MMIVPQRKQRSAVSQFLWLLVSIATTPTTAAMQEGPTAMHEYSQESTAFYEDQLEAKRKYYNGRSAKSEDQQTNVRRRELQQQGGVPQRYSCGQCCGYQIEDAAGHNDLDNWYGKVLVMDGGFKITASAATSDAALYEAALTLDRMTVKRPDFLPTLVAEGVHMAILGKDEKLTSVPEYSTLGSGWDWARGVGATRWIPVTSCAEENLLCLPGDIYQGENICVHENAHTLTGSGGKLPLDRDLILGDPSYGTLDEAIREAFDQSVHVQGKWKNTYAAVNHEEFFAEGTQSFYNANWEGPYWGNGIHNDISTRAKLMDYDPMEYELIQTIFPSEINSFDCPTSIPCDCSTFVCPKDMFGNNDMDEPSSFPTLQPINSPLQIPDADTDGISEEPSVQPSELPSTSPSEAIVEEVIVMPEKPVLELRPKKCSKKDLCTECQGTCKKDDECADGLECFRANGKTSLTPIPGCLGLADSENGYCFAP